MTVALITGIAGQDGSYLAEALLGKGYEVHGLVRSRSAVDSGSETVDGRAQLHVVDISEASTLATVISEVDPDEIYNLAALSSVRLSWTDPVQTALVNAVPVAQVLESAWQLQLRRDRQVRVIQASSAELFGRASESPQSETTLIQPSSPYGASKAYAHHMVGLYRARGLFASSCILYNHESPRRPESFVTRKITAAAARISRGLQQSLQLGSLDTRRDWGWAPDYAAAMELAAHAESSDDFIIATGESHSIEEFTSLAFDRAGITDWRSYVSVDSALGRPNDPVDQVGDSSKARRELGWQPSKSFTEIVHAMVDHDLALLDAYR